MEKHVFSKRRETKSEVFQHTVWFCTIKQNSSSLLKTEYLLLDSQNLLLKGNAYNNSLYYIKNDSFLIEEV